MKQGWTIKKLGEVCHFQNGFAFKSNLFTKAGEPIVRISDIQNEKVCVDNLVYFSLDSYKEDLSRFVVYPNDILIAMSGGTTGKLGINRTGRKFYLNQRVGVFREDKKVLDHSYLFYYLHTKSDESLRIAAGAAQPNLSTAQVNAFEIPIPPLFEQQRIVSLLDAEFAKIDALKANAEKNLQNAKDLFQAALKKELEPKEGWKVVKLHEITEICLGLTHTPKYVEDGVPFVSVKDISSGYLDLSATKRISREEFTSFPYGAKPKRGDVLFCRVGTMGHPLVLEIDEEFGTFVSVGFLRPNTNIVSPYYLRYWMLSPMFNKQVDDNVVGSTLKNLNTGWLKHFSVPVPPKEHLPSLVGELTLLEQKCKTLQANYEKTLTLCDDLKQALLRKAFNGEI